MNFEVKNPKEDQYGNSKENIFIAYSSDGAYLGSAFAYPSINYYQTYETPYLIFIGINMAENLDTQTSKEIRQKLFDMVIKRAKILRQQRPELKARIYSGFLFDQEKLDFFIGNGFEEDYSIVMQADIPNGFQYAKPEHVEVRDCDFETDEAFAEYKRIYDEIFVSPLDREAIIEQSKLAHFKNLSFFIDGKLQGGCTVFEKDGFGYIETVYVAPDALGKGVSKVIMNYILHYFHSVGLDKTRLEVWQINKRAVELYKTFGYTEVQKNLMFPGITL